MQWHRGLYCLLLLLLLLLLLCSVLVANLHV